MSDLVSACCCVVPSIASKGVTGSQVISVVTTAHFPPQLYVRASNRLVGERVLTQASLARPRRKRTPSRL